MGGDPRDRHLRRLYRRRRAARRWTAYAGTLGAATAVLVPYAGVGLPDAAWAAAAGGATVLAVFRWFDYRRLAGLPVPEPRTGDEPAGSGWAKLMRGNPLGRSLGDELRRQRERIAFRDSAATATWQRLDRASRAMPALAERLPSSAAEAAVEGLAVETVLRDLAYRIVDVERGIAAAPSDARGSLAHARDGLVEQLTEGVDAYERLVAAAAECVAEGARSVDNSAATRLTEATDRLVGFATGLGELRDLRTS
ncbi:MAG: phage shock envelope stress response protein PspM [Micromonosporaceae bacterium]